MTIPIVLIAGVAENGVIGAGNRIPWRIPSDMAFFKATTMGKPIVMGRKQYESVGRPLPGRTNIVVTRQPGWTADGVIVEHDLDAALDRARAVAAGSRATEAMVIGGGEIYAAALPLAERLYISQIALAPEGDVFFPPIDPGQWQVVREILPEPDPRDAAPYLVKVYERR